MTVNATIIANGLRSRPSERAATARAGEIYAALDLGSNSFHMIVAQGEAGGMRIIDRLREPVRLAAGLRPDGYLDPGTADKALGALARLGERLNGVPVNNRRAVGTNTIRRLQDDEKFLSRANEVLGQEIEVVSGIEEARLIYLAVATAMPNDGQIRLVIDIGGGSTEVICGSEATPDLAESLFMGCISMTQRYFDDGRVSPRRLAEAVLAARTELEPVQEAFSNSGWSRAVGCSGSVRAIAQVLEANRWATGDITRGGIDNLLKIIGKSKELSDLDLRCIRQDRRPIFLGGVAILAALFESLEIEELSICDWSLREGVLFDLIGRKTGQQDIRELAVSRLAQRYHVDADHARRVRDTARDLLEKVAGAWGLLDEANKKMLDWAAVLHDLGRDIAHTQFHKHGAYVIANTDLSGFARHEQAVLACLVRVHRRKFALEVFDTLSPAWKPRARYLAVILRLSALLHRGRHAWQLPKMQVEASADRLSLRFPQGWLADHPLSAEDLDRERDYLKTAGIQFKFG